MLKRIWWQNGDPHIEREDGSIVKYVFDPESGKPWCRTRRVRVLVKGADDEGIDENPVGGTDCDCNGGLSEERQ